MRRHVSIWMIMLCTVSFAHSEVTRLPFFPAASTFADTPLVFPGFCSWVKFAHGLNQSDAPDTAHSLDTGSILTFWANNVVAVSGLAREIFQFRQSPNGDWQFWARALVSDLRLEAALNAEPFAVAAGYRHDCKHDIAEMRRESIHDAIFARASITHARLPFIPRDCDAHGGFSLEAEMNLPTVFQKGPAESDRGRLSFEGEIVPCTLAHGRIGSFIDAGISFVKREENGRVVVTSEWNEDWHAGAGIDIAANLGRLRLTWEIERVTDGWASLEPVPQTGSSISLAFIFIAKEITPMQ